MKSKIVTFFLFFICLSVSTKAQFYSVKTDLLGLASTNLNAEISMTLNRKISLHVPISYNPFVLNKNFRMQNFTIQPGARYWFLESYVRNFLGVNAILSSYHLGDKKARYEGNAYGIGISYGYAYPIGKKWNFELEAGVGAVWSNYTKYVCKSCGKKIGDYNRMYVVPTKLSASVVYLF